MGLAGFEVTGRREVRCDRGDQGSLDSIRTCDGPMERIWGLRSRRAWVGDRDLQAADLAWQGQ